jgi:hypothetical protein
MPQMLTIILNLYNENYLSYNSVRLKIVQLFCVSCAEAITCWAFIDAGVWITPTAHNKGV